MADKEIKDIQALINLSGVSRTVINKLFHNRDIETVKIDSLIRLCDTLDCKLSDLLEYTPDR